MRNFFLKHLPGLPLEDWQSLRIEGDSVYLCCRERMVRMDRAGFVALLEETLGCCRQENPQPGCWHELNG